MTHGCGFGLASLLSLFFAASLSLIDGSLNTRTIRSPDGDHQNPPTSWIVLVSVCASPPSRLSSQTSSFLLSSSPFSAFPRSRPERNARYFPSGLQRG